jgi:hypothetical protein
MIKATETTMHRLLLETLWQSSGRVTEVLRLRLSPMPQRCTKCTVPNSRWWSLYVDQSCHHASVLSRKFLLTWVCARW